MRIALLAPAGGGKTCYLTSLYGELSELASVSENRSPLLYEFLDIKQNGELEKNLSLILEGEEPQPTEMYKDYQIKVRHRIHGLESIITLADFPGGRLNKTGGDEHEIQDILNKLSSCDAFIILIDAAHLKDKTGRKLKRAIASANISHLLLEVIEIKKKSKYSLHGIPFIFAVSKLDKLDSDHLISKSHQIISDTFQQFFEHEDCISVITQVSIGENIDGKDAGKPKGEYEPKNIFLPFYLALGIGMMSSARFCRKEADTIGEDIKDVSKIKSDAEKEYNNALSKYDERRSKDPLDRFKLLIKTEYGVGTLERTKNSKQQDLSNAESNLRNEHVRLNDKEFEIKSLRYIGSSILNQINRKHIEGDKIEALIFQDRKRMTLAFNISKEYDDILIPLQK